MCCQLTGLIGMEGRRSLGEELGVPPQVHLAEEQLEELTRALCLGLGMALLTACSLSPPLMVVKKEEQSTSNSANLAWVQIPQRNLGGLKRFLEHRSGSLRP